MNREYGVFIAGAGGIGRAVALLLANDRDLQCNIYIGDISESALHQAVEWITKGLELPRNIRVVQMPDTGTDDDLEQIFHRADILLDCLPGRLAPSMAGFARQFHMHYVNLTEYVKETEEIVDIATGADTGFVLQTGLAPGFINVLGKQLFEQFCERHGVEKVEKITKRVGALTKYTQSPHYYGFTWSPVGVATEYIKDSIVLRDGQIRMLPSLSERETILIDGVRYEADLTSGGVADFPNALHDKTRDLDYKTIRYPGHYDWVQEVIAGIDEDDARIRKLEQIMLEQIPAVEEDVVIIFASVTGRDRYGKLRSMQRSFRITPMKIGGQILRAIQATTAAPLAECARMLLTGDETGPIYQSNLDTERFMNGPIIRQVYFPDKLPVGHKSAEPAF